MLGPLLSSTHHPNEMRSVPPPHPSHPQQTKPHILRASELFLIRTTFAHAHRIVLLLVLLPSRHCQATHCSFPRLVLPTYNISTALMDGRMPHHTTPFQEPGSWSSIDCSLPPPSPPLPTSPFPTWGQAVSVACPSTTTKQQQQHRHPPTKHLPTTTIT